MRGVLIMYGEHRAGTRNEADEGILAVGDTAMRLEGETAVLCKHPAVALPRIE